MVTPDDIGKRAYVILKAGFRSEVQMRAEGVIVSVKNGWCEIDTGGGGRVSGPVADFFLVETPSPTNPHTHTPQ